MSDCCCDQRSGIALCRLGASHRAIAPISTCWLGVVQSQSTRDFFTQKRMLIKCIRIRRIVVKILLTFVNDCQSTLSNARTNTLRNTVASHSNKYQGMHHIIHFSHLSAALSPRDTHIRAHRHTSSAGSHCVCRGVWMRVCVCARLACAFSEAISGLRH